MAEDWLTDVRKYASDADEGVVGSIVKYCGIALTNRDSSLVSFSDEVEVARVRDNFLRKKLGLTDPDSRLDDGVAWVKNLMIGDRTKNRVTAYYLLSHYFGKLDLFGGRAGTSAASLAGGEAGATGVAALTGTGFPATSEPAVQRAPVGRADSSSPAIDARSKTTDAQLGSETEAVAMPSAGNTRPDSAPPLGNQPAYAADLPDQPSGWPRWLTWVLIALAVLALFLLMRSCAGENTALSEQEAAAGADATLPVDSGVGAGGSQTGGTTTLTAVPAGAGVVSELRNNKPLLTVYFDSGKAAVSNDLATASAALKSYLAANPEARLAVSGYNDPSGNAAANAELSKNRAQAVAAALAATGISQTSIELVKPDETTNRSITAGQARRVEVSIR